MDAIIMIVAWVGSHPTSVSLAVWFVASVLAAIFKPKSPAEYAAMTPWKATAWRLLAAAVSDFPKVIKVARELYSGSPDPKKISVEDVAKEATKEIE